MQHELSIKVLTKVFADTDGWTEGEGTTMQISSVSMEIHNKNKILMYFFYLCLCGHLTCYA
jgi:hypothetical protein